MMTYEYEIQFTQRSMERSVFGITTRYRKQNTQMRNMSWMMNVVKRLNRLHTCRKINESGQHKCQTGTRESVWGEMDESCAQQRQRVEPYWRGLHPPLDDSADKFEYRHDIHIARDLPHHPVNSHHQLHIHTIIECTLPIALTRLFRHTTGC